MKKIVTIVVLALIAALAIPVQAEWKWENFGADPFAKTRAEAMRKRESVFRKAKLPTQVVSLLVEETKKPGEPVKINVGDKLAWTTSEGDVMHGLDEGGVVVAFKSPIEGMEYSAPAEEWQVLWEGATYRVLLPKVCNNWSGKAPMLTISAPPPSAGENPAVGGKVAPPVATAPFFSTKECPNGYSLIANAWSLSSMPQDLREKAKTLIGSAEDRDSQNATNAAAYKADAVSRTIGGRLRKEAKIRAAVNAGLKVQLRDPQKAAVTKSLGTLNVASGTGRIKLADDPHKWIIETIWPENFSSSAVSGGERRLWLFPDEWGKFCTMNVHGLVP